MGGGGGGAIQATGKKLFLPILISLERDGPEVESMFRTYRSKPLSRTALEKRHCWEHPERRPEAGAGRPRMEAWDQVAF